MSYFKHVELVALEGLFSPAPAASYAKKIEIVDFINPDGTKWTPTPAPVDPLSCATKTTTYGETVVGKTLTGTLAVYEGGAQPVEELYQWQRSDDGSSWTGITNWTDIQPTTGTTSSYTTVAADKNKYIRFASKAIDSDMVTVYGSGNNVGPITAPPIIITDPTIMTDGLYSNPQEVYGYQTISMHSAVFAGGYGTITTKYRLQEQPGGVGDWVNLTGWQSGIPTYNVSQSLPGDKLRFQTQGKDSLGTQKTSNSSVATVGVTTEIGTLSIAPPQEQADAGQIVTFDALISGDASPLYTWNIRNGPGQIWSASNIGQQIEVKVNDDAQSGESISVQVTAADLSASDNPQSTVSLIVVN